MGTPKVRVAATRLDAVTRVLFTVTFASPDVAWNFPKLGFLLRLTKRLFNPGLKSNVLPVTTAEEDISSTLTVEGSSVSVSLK